MVAAGVPSPSIWTLTAARTGLLLQLAPDATALQVAPSASCPVQTEQVPKAGTLVFVEEDLQAQVSAHHPHPVTARHVPHVLRRVHGSLHWEGPTDQASAGQPPKAGAPAESGPAATHVEVALQYPHPGTAAHLAQLVENAPHTWAVEPLPSMGEAPWNPTWCAAPRTMMEAARMAREEEPPSPEDTTTACRDPTSRPLMGGTDTAPEAASMTAPPAAVRFTSRASDWPLGPTITICTGNNRKPTGCVMG